MTWFYLALLAPLIYAVVNLIDDNLLRTVYKSPYVGAIVSGLFAGLPLLVIPFVDVAAIEPRFAFLAALVGFLNTLFLFFYFKALEQDSPSVVVALLGVMPALLPLFAGPLLGEQLSHLELIGIPLVLLPSAGLVINRGEGLKVSRALISVATASLLLLVNSLIIKHVYENAPFLTAYLSFSVGMVVGGLYLFLVLYHLRAHKVIKGLRTNLRKYFMLFVLTELLGISAEFVINLAISRGPVSIVRAIEGTQPVYVLLIAVILYPFNARLFREATEGNKLRKFVLLLSIVAGLTLIELGSKG